MNTNGNNKPSHLDKLLESKPPEFQAKVLRFALDSGMKENDPAFRLVQYIGYLAQLTESAPEDWKQLFRQLLAELQEWTLFTNGQLETAASQMEVIRRLGTNCETLSTALNALDLTSRQQLQQLITLNETLPNFGSVGQEIMRLNAHRENTSKELTSIKQVIEMLVQSQHKIIKRIQALNENINSNVAGIWNFDSWGKIIGVVVVMFITAVMASVMTVNVFASNPRPLSDDTVDKISFIRQHVDYNYTKLQRIEEALGIKPTKKQK